MRKILFILILIYSVSPIYAQENWGPAESIINESWNNFYCAGYGFYHPSISSNDSLLFLTYDCLDISGIAYSVYQDGQWQTPETLQVEILMEYPAPLFYYDHADTLLYFGSGMPGGYGGSDIWAIRFIDNNWTQPFNLGPAINSASWETSPSVPDDDSRLYFARGGTIMYSDKINGQYMEPIALPSIINSDLTELYPRISRDGQRLYFNRYGVYYLPDTMMVSYFLNGEWQQPFVLNGYINYNNSPCPMIPASSRGPSFNSDGSKMYFSRFELYEFFCDPIFDIYVSENITEINDDPIPPPSALSLSAYPNPFNSRTNISIEGNLDALSEIAIYDITGRKIRSFEPASHITWDGTDSRGTPVSSGIYFVKAAGADFERSLRITLIK